MRKPQSGDESEEITVNQDEAWKIRRTPGVITTTVLGPCVGLIIYDPVRKQALVGHFVDPRWNDFIGAVREAIRRFRGTGHLKVWIGGGEPQFFDAPLYMDSKAKRGFVVRTLHDAGFRDDQIVIQWLEPNQSTILGIHTGTGCVAYDTADDPEIDDPEDPEDED